MYQEIAWQVSLLGGLFLAAVFLLVVMRSGNPAEYGPIQKRFYRFRALWFWGLVAVGSWLSVETLASLPYGPTHGKEGGPAEVTVDVTGHQWYWDMSRTEVPAGRTVQFNVTSADVNHGFAIYNADDEVVAQTQAMPEYTNKLRHTFREPGTYRVMCLEYCGPPHHNMTAEIQVTAEKEG
ncbi:MAG: cytochrome C oxidase subunit II [Thiohalorhabdus sp.]|uniref:cytochrome C oxidase subunit II n=1 Tax=Thiohalorhabdus sp. TaxID=3094134 RepID=UPI00397FBC1F